MDDLILRKLYCNIQSFKWRIWLRLRRMQQIIQTTVRSSRGLFNWQGYGHTQGSSQENAFFSFFFTQAISPNRQKYVQGNACSNKSQMKAWKTICESLQLLTHKTCMRRINRAATSWWETCLNEGRSSVSKLSLYITGRLWRNVTRCVCSNTVQCWVASSVLDSSILKSS